MDESEFEVPLPEGARPEALLRDVLESIGSGCALLDADLHFIYCSNAFVDDLSGIADLLTPDTPLADALKGTIDRGFIEPPAEGTDAYVAQRLAEVAAGRPTTIRRLVSGRVVRVDAHPVSGGGRLLVRTDVTEMTRARADAERQAALLRDAVECIEGGVVLYDAEERFQWCNNWIRNELSRIDHLLQPGTPFEDIAHGMYRAGYVHDHATEEGYVAWRLNEFRTLATSVLTLTENEHHYLHRHYRTTDGGTLIIRTDISDLRRAQHAAELASRAKSEFLSSMSHEVRTPLNAVLGFAQMMELPGDDPLTPDQRERLNHIIDSGEHLLALLDQVLELSRIESGAVDVAEEAVDLAAVIQSVIDAAHIEADAHGIALVVEPSATPPAPLRSDATRIRQILLNLVSNATKYNRPGGSVRIAVAGLDNGYTRITVADDGPGIPVGRRQHLFEPFNRLGREGGQVKGSGVGLTICRRIAEALGARLDFDSDVDGTIFWLDLPPADITGREA